MNRLIAAAALALLGCQPPTPSGDAGVDAGVDAGTSPADAGQPRADLIFASDWSTATGSSTAALRDTSSPTPWAEVTNPSAHAVVANANLGFPATMPNVLRMTYPGGSSAEVRCFDCWSAPAVGQSRFFRWYFRFDIPNSYGDLTIQPHHPFAARFGQCPNEWEFKFGPRSNGSLEMFIPFYASNVILLPPMPLQKSTTYRVELGFHRTAATTYKLDVRFYDSNGALLFDDDDLRLDQRPGQTLASADPDITISLDTCVRSLQLGSNGPGADWTVLTNNDAFLYLGGVAVRPGDWVGPYVAGEKATP